MERYIYDLMRDKQRGFMHMLPKFLLFIISLFYAVVIKIWNFCYDKGIARRHAVNAKVISIGNITLGGTGKTPFVVFIAELLKKSGKRVAILTRGYGDDEWRMLEDNLLKAPVIKGRDRIKSAAEAIKRHNADTLILDDGFQHRRIKRDVDIVLLDAHQRLDDMRLFPRGLLREPLDSIKRADMVVLTKADFGEENIRNFRITLSGDFKKHHTLESIYKPVCFLDLKTQEHLGLDIVCGKRICALSAIADPDYFKYMLKNLGANIMISDDYPDHHNYTEKDLDYIGQKAKESGCDFIITTEKDSVKLSAIPFGEAQLRFAQSCPPRGGSASLRTQLSAIPILALHIEFEITKGMEELLARLNSLYHS